MQAHDIEALILEAMPGAFVRVESPDSVHFEAIVVSEAFEGLSLLKQQQQVNAILKEHLLSNAIHALALKTYTPAQWQDNQ